MSTGKLLKQHDKTCRVTCHVLAFHPRGIEILPVTPYLKKPEKSAGIDWQQTLIVNKFIFDCGLPLNPPLKY